MTIFRKGVGLTLSRVFARRGFSTDVCYVMGDQGAIPMDGSVFVAVKEHLKSQPFLSAVPKNSVFGNKGGPYHLEDPIRKYLKSGCINVCMLADSEQPIADPFEEDNVGVHLRLGIMVFKRLVASEKKLSLSQLFHKYVMFMKKLIHDQHGAQAVFDSPDDLKSLWDHLCKPDITPESASDHPSLF